MNRSGPWTRVDLRPELAGVEYGLELTVDSGCHLTLKVMANVKFFTAI